MRKIMQVMMEGEIVDGAELGIAVLSSMGPEEMSERTRNIFEELKDEGRLQDYTLLSACTAIAAAVMSSFEDPPEETQQDEDGPQEEE